MQGIFKKLVPSSAAHSWHEDRERFVRNLAEKDGARVLNFESAVFEKSDEEEIPSGYVLAVVSFSISEE